MPPVGGRYLRLRPLLARIHSEVAFDLASIPLTYGLCSADVHQTTGKPPLRVPDYPHFNIEVIRANGKKSTAHVYLPAPRGNTDIVLVTLGVREENLARVEAAYADIGLKLVGKDLVETGQGVGSGSGGGE